jgi:PAS domain S-box-containing protein
VAPEVGSEPRSEEEALLGSLENADPFLLLDRGWRIVRVNASTERATGRRREALVGLTLWEAWPEMLVEPSAYVRELERCMAERVQVRFEEYFRPTSMWTEVTATPTPSGGLLASFRDVSARKRAEGRARAAEAELQQRERELERVFAMSPDVVIEIGRDELLHRANPACARLLGRPVEELVGHPCMEHLHPDDRATMHTQIERTLAGAPAPARFVVRVLGRGDGNVRWVSFDAGADAGADLLVAVGQDVTAEHGRSELEQQLIGIVSHDLRNPLSAIDLAVHSLLRRGDLEPRTRAVVLRIQSAVERGIALIRDLLDFTSARRPGGIPISPQPLDLHAAVASAVKELRPAWPGREVRVTHAGDGTGSWDPARIDQLVQNLVSNALKYGAPDRPIEVRTLGGDRWVRIEVWNGGEPIEPALLPHLFEPLRRAARTGDVGGVRGVGLGLYIVDHIVRAHGGTVDVVSSTQAGTTFVARLPREPPPPQEAEGDPGPDDGDAV